MTENATRLHVVAGDATDGGYYVVDAATSRQSFVMVPRDKTWHWQTRPAAQAQADDLNKRIAAGESIALRMYDTPERFEAVADTKYGSPWR